jgi:polysaccharide export outer membrane protein
MLRSLFLAGAGLAAMAAGPSWTQTAVPGAGSPAAQAPQTPPAALTSGPVADRTQSAAAVPAEYRIGRDDDLQILVFQVPELSQTVRVDANGEFILPFVGRVSAAGHTAGELADILRAKLEGRYLRDPQVTVMVKNAVAQRVTVNGAVVQPGVYALTGPTTLLQALALARGADTRIANRHRVAIFRNVGGQRQAQLFDLINIEDGRKPDPTVQADDIIVVDTSGVRSFFTYFGSTIPVLAAIHP